MLAGHRGVPVSKCEDLASDSSVTVVVDEVPSDSGPPSRLLRKLPGTTGGDARIHDMGGGGFQAIS